jgi:uncharacterized delta-60 repeat protein
MWFLSARTTRKNRRVSSSQCRRHAFRPRLEAIEDRCLLSAGTLDPTFGSAGFVTGPILAVAPNSNIDHPAVAMQSNGKIVVGANIMGANGYLNFALARYNGNGSLDTSFGPNHNGVVANALGAQDSWINALAIDASGRIVAVGHAINKVGAKSYYDAFALARYTADGNLDSTFGSNGVVLTNFAGLSGITDKDLGAAAVVIQGDGRINVAGTAQTVTVTGKGANTTTTVCTDFTLARYLTSGALDTSFGTAGVSLTSPFGAGPNYANALALLPNGKLVSGGCRWSSNGRCALYS